MSGQLSGTVSSAEVAAATAPVPVLVVDSRSIGMGLGLVVLAAARAARAGLAAEEVAAVAERHAADSGSFFALDSPQPLLAGGRLSPAPAIPVAGAAIPVPGVVGPAPGADSPALISRPLLEIRAGQITTLERVRTRAAAADRLIELSADFAAGRTVDIAVQHTASPERAAALASRLASAIPAARYRYLSEADPVIRAHAGLGMLAVALTPCWPGRTFRTGDAGRYPGPPIGAKQDCQGKRDD
jgi:fatty acid-binding protein DegV